MLKSNVYSSFSKQTHFVSSNTFVLSNVNNALLLAIRRPWQKQQTNFKPNASLFRLRPPIRAPAVAGLMNKSCSAIAIVTVKKHPNGFLSNFELKTLFDAITDLLGTTLLLEIVSAETDTMTGLEKGTIKSYARKTYTSNEEIQYEAKFEIPKDFGVVGAIFVENGLHKEMFVKDIVVYSNSTHSPFHFPCNSWVHSKFQSNNIKRIFFTIKSYLPSKTPDGLKKLREKELRNLRGNGQGKRETHERVYDYDVYNDLGNPDKGDDYKRPILGGKEHPYPRRCRTGRRRSKTDPLSETRPRNYSDIYVPRDEAFQEIKQVTFLVKTLHLALHATVPSLSTSITDSKLAFPFKLFRAIFIILNNAKLLPPLPKWRVRPVLPRLTDVIADKIEDVLFFNSPDMFDGEKFFWFRDEEFARQTLAGLNPSSIKLVTEWPLKSKLDPDIYGSPDSAITDLVIEQQIKGYMTLDEAIKQKKLFILDYHDLFLPYVSKVRKLKGRTLYGSRTLFFLTPKNTLMPLAIELTRPRNRIDNKPQWKDVFTPCCNATDLWLWRIAKAHVLSHEFAHYQLVGHWLRTHCCVEPYIIATHRQLSVMHPIYRLLRPHFRYTMEINAVSREAHMNGDGITETMCSLGKYSLELSSLAYNKEWKFNLEALPADLIHRGLAVEDPNAPHGLKLTIEDYPFANDGLILWDAIKEWATANVNHYYPDSSLIKSDNELQAWWTEIRTKGHGDKQNEPWWPILETPNDLIDIITTIMWVTSGLHAAMNFGKDNFARYFPKWPRIARINMPTEEPNSKLWKYFFEKPEMVLLNTFGTQSKSTIVMAVLNMLSNYNSTNKEYLGRNIEPEWENEAAIKEAFEKFSMKLKEFETIINERNVNSKLKNRHGAGVVPYQVLKPDIQMGLFGRGIPYSISS